MQFSSKHEKRDHVTIQDLAPHTHLQSLATAQEGNVKSVSLLICQKKTTSKHFDSFYDQECVPTVCVQISVTSINVTYQHASSRIYHAPYHLRDHQHRPFSQCPSTFLESLDHIIYRQQQNLFISIYLLDFNSYLTEMFRVLLQFK